MCLAVGNIISFITAVTNVLYQFEKKSDYMAFFCGVLIVSVEVQIHLKQFSSNFYREQFQKLFNWVQELPKKKFDEILGNKPARVIQRMRVYSSAFFVGYNLNYIITASAYAIRVTWKVVDRRPFLRVPFISNDHPYFYTIDTINCIFCFISVGASCPILDCPLVIIGAQLMGFLDIIKDAIKHLQKNEEKSKYSQILRHTFQHHFEFIEYLNKFNESIRFASLFQFLGSILMFLCTISTIMVFPSEILMYQNIFCVFLQLALICFFGQLIENKTKHIYEELCQINWYDLSFADKKRFLIMLRMSQREYCVKAGGMYPINLPMLIQIVKVAVTYCTIMVTFI
ncbi:hypothetical protein DMENIID0001_158260 [Sergentomyia squamirostris]